MDRFHLCPSPESSRVGHSHIQRKVKDFFSFCTCSMSGSEGDWTILLRLSAVLRNALVLHGNFISIGISFVKLLGQNFSLRYPEAWLTHLRGRDHASEGETDTEPSSSQTAVQARIADEVEVLRWCIDWLAQWERGEMVVGNLRPATEDLTEFVQVDQVRVRRVLARIAADLAVLARHDPTTELECPAESMEPRTQHRRRLAEPEEEPPRGRTATAHRDALRNAFGLPPYSGDYSEYFRPIRGANT